MTTFNQQGQTVHGDQYNAAGNMHLNKQDTIHHGDVYSGDFQSAILNVRSTLTNVTQVIGAIPHASEGEKQKLEALMKQLTTTLEQILQSHPEAQEEVETVAETAKVLIEGAKEDAPKRGFLKITGEGLIKAAENLAKLTPPVLAISKQLVEFVLGLVAKVG
jgi:hypothetical protein